MSHCLTCSFRRFHHIVLSLNILFTVSVDSRGTQQTALSSIPPHITAVTGFMNPNYASPPHSPYKSTRLIPEARINEIAIDVGSVTHKRRLAAEAARAAASRAEADSLSNASVETVRAAPTAAPRTQVAHAVIEHRPEQCPSDSAASTGQFFC